MHAVPSQKLAIVAPLQTVASLPRLCENSPYWAPLQAHRAFARTRESDPISKQSKQAPYREGRELHVTFGRHTAGLAARMAHGCHARLHVKRYD